MTGFTITSFATFAGLVLAARRLAADPDLPTAPRPSPARRQPRR